MKKIRHNIQRILFSGTISLIIACFSCASFSKLPEQHPLNPAELPLHHPYASSKGIDKLSKKTKSDVVVNKEIWTRLRSQMKMQPATHSARYQRHIRSLSRSPGTVNKLINNASPYLYFVLEEVEKRGMPSEIALLPMVESEFYPRDLSHKGAAGLWQIMPVLGRWHGLKQTHAYDGRRDIYESTKVALDHLQYLNKRFNGNWPLTLAAYNAGEFRVLKAIKRNRAMHKSTDYWSLPLPKETQDYVPKLLAWSEIVRNPKKYGLTLPAIQNKPVFTRLQVHRPVSFSYVAQLANTTESHVRKLNPGYRNGMHPTGPCHLVVPISHAAVVQTKLGAKPVATAKAKKPQTKPVQVAQKKTTTSKTQSDQSDGKMTAKSGQRIHIVKKGECISKISKRYKVSPKTLIAKNGLKSRNAVIHPGQKLKV